MGDRCDFDKRSGSATLRALSGSPSYSSTAILNQQAGGDAWRLVHAYSKSNLPFQLRLRWSTGENSGLEAQITVPRAIRTCIYARALEVHAANLAPEANSVIVVAPTGYADTHNVFEATGPQSIAEQLVTVPPFATRLRLDLEQDTAYSTSHLRVVDASGTTRAHVFGNSQPEQGLPLGSAREVYVNATASWRITYFLQL